MINIFVNTWGNYNKNGADGGQWITLPMEPDKLEEVLENIAEAMGDEDPEWAIYDCEWEPEWVDLAIDGSENIQGLNEYAQKLDALDKRDREIYCAAAEYWGAKQIDIDDLGSYCLHTDIHSEYDLGYYWAIESGCFEIDEKSPLSRYFNYKAFGRDINFETDGGFTSFGWIERR